MRKFNILAAGLLLAASFTVPVRAQRVIPAGEPLVPDGTYCNIGGLAGTSADITFAATPCYLAVHGLMRFNVGGTSSRAWASAGTIPAGNVANTYPVVGVFEGTTSALNVAASTVIKASAGRLYTVNVITAGAAGAIHDTTTTGAAAAANQVAVIPAVVGTYKFNWPMSNGIVYILGAGQVVAISYN